MNKLKVVIADDERLFLQGMNTLLQAQEEFVLVGAAADGEEALRMVEEHHPDILLTDIRMPRMDGIGLIKQIESRVLSVMVIIISAYDDREYVQYAIRSPVVYDYINKPFSKEEFAEQLRTAAAYRRQQIKRPEQQAGGEEWSLIQAVIQGETQQALILLRSLWNKRNDGDLSSNIRFAGELLLKIGLQVQPEKEAPHTTACRIYHEIQKLEQCQSEEETERYLENYITQFHADPKKQERSKSVFILSCLDIINRRLEDSSLSVSEVARELNVTDNYLSSRFSRDMDVNFTRYVTMARSERAKEYLKDTHLKIYAISERLGFNDPRYFVKVFKEYVGLRPSEYREQILNREKQEGR